MRTLTLRKLKSIGISGKVGRWLQSFLTGRQQSVVINKRTVWPTTSAIWSSSRFGPRTAAVPCADWWHWWACSLIVPVKFCWWHQNHARHIQPRRHRGPETRLPCCLSVGKEKQHGVQFRQIRTPKVFPLRISRNWNNLSGRQWPGNWSEIQPWWSGSHYEWWHLVLHIHQGKGICHEIKSWMGHTHFQKKRQIPDANTMEATDPKWPWLLLTTMESPQSRWHSITRTRAAIFPWLQLSAGGVDPVSIDCWLEWPVGLIHAGHAWLPPGIIFKMTRRPVEYWKSLNHDSN